MKKRVLLYVVAVLVLAGVLYQSFVGLKPFKSMTTSDIDSVSVYVLPPNVEVELSREEISELVDILKDVVTYNVSFRHLISGGQSVQYTITFTDGTQKIIRAFSPSLIIDNVGFRIAYEPCEALNRLANSSYTESDIYGMTEYENALPPLVCIEGKLYQGMVDSIDEPADDPDGTIKTVNLTDNTVPNENEEANWGCVGMEYWFVDEGLCVFYNRDFFLLKEIDPQTGEWK